MDNLWKYSVVIMLSALSIYAVALGKIIIHELYYRAGFLIIASTMDLSCEILQTTSIIHKLVFCFSSTESNNFYLKWYFFI